MSDLPPEIIERMRIHRSQSIDEDGPYESGDHDFENDALTIIDAYLAEHDPTPLDAEWLVSVGGEKEYPGDDLREIVHIPADGVEWVRVVFPKTLDRKPLFGVRVAFGQVWSIPVPTRGTFRTAMRLFGIEIEEKAQ